MVSMKTVLTIGRQFGSGGHEIGRRVAVRLNIPCYDREMLQMAAEKSGLSEKLLENLDERPRSLLYSVAMNAYLPALPGAGAGDSLEQQVYMATYDAIRQLAEEGPCVLIGRCADHALEGNPNLLRLFIYAPVEQRIKKVMEREKLDREQARMLIARTDKRRGAYYEYYSMRKWGVVENYDFCLDSSVFGYDGTEELITKLVKMREAHSSV